MVKYGGHELAAGVSVKRDDLVIFRKKINEYAKTQAVAVPKLNIDFKLNPTGMSVDMAFAIKSLEPFGMGNPTPIFGIFGVKLEKLTSIGGGKHLKLLCRKNESVFQAVLFGVTQQQFCFAVGDTLDLAVTLDTNLYQGQYSLSVQIKALKMSDTDQDLYFIEKQRYDDFVSGFDTDYSAVFPDRAQVGIVYKAITTSPINAERLKHIDMKIGYAKTQIAVDTLCELSLVSLNNGVLVSHSTNQKNDLMNSNTYKKIYERVNGYE